MQKVVVKDRLTGEMLEEKIYYGSLLRFLYGSTLASRCIGPPLIALLSKLPLMSMLVGWWKRQPITKKSIRTFIEEYGVDASEFRDPVDSFDSFNAFFIRKLKGDARPIAPGDGVAIVPADGRYLVYPDISRCDGFLVKGAMFSLENLLQNRELAKKYATGAMVMARLCPSDYHRNHFPVACIPGDTRSINGSLYSVNPIALLKNIRILTENKRTLCVLKSAEFGEALFLEVGATNVGSIHQTYTPHTLCAKGSEKGYFSFGGSTLILLFEAGKIVFEKDLVEASKQRIEMRCLMGQRLGTAAKT